MTARHRLSAGIAAGAVLALAAQATLPQVASAQTTPAQPPISYGAPIPGFCTFSFNQIMAQSKVGQSVVARLKQLDQTWRAELQPQADAINTDKRALDAQAASLDAATRDAKEAALQLRYSNFEKLVQQRQQEMQATQQKEIGVVSQELEPVLRQLFQTKSCSVLIERDQGGVSVVNPLMDLSVQAVSSLDAKIQTLTFDRVHMDQTSGAAPAAR